MCGRFTLTVTPQALAEQFFVDSIPPLLPRYNIAPTQPVAVVRIRPGHVARELALLQWGLIPSWAEDPAISSRLINARAESVAEKPAFRTAFMYRRCLIAADGFYEWKGKGRLRQPYYFRMKSGKLLAFAGLWEHWEGADGSYIETCTIITTHANDLVQPIHERMPVIVRPEDYDFWLDAKMQKIERLEMILQPFPVEDWVVYPVSSRVNSPGDDEPEFIEPLPIESLFG